MVKTTLKISKKHKKNLDELNSYFKFITKNEKVWKKKGEGYLMFKKSETMIKKFLPDIEKEYVSLKRCSQEHCRKEFDIIINKVLIETQKDVKKMFDKMDKLNEKIKKENGMKKGESMFDLTDKKQENKIRKKMQDSDKKIIKKHIALQKQKYGKYEKALKECQLKHCKNDRNTLKKTLKKKTKNDFAKMIHKSI